MDSSKKYDNPSPRLTANPVSKLLFWWLKPLFQYGKSHDLEIKDLQNALDSDLSQPLGDLLERHWIAEQEAALQVKRPPKLINALRKTFFWPYLRYGVGIFTCVALRVLLPYVLGLLIGHFQPGATTTSGDAYMLASIVVLLSIIVIFLEHHTNLGQLEIGLRVRVACSSVIYRKSLRLSRYSADKASGGQLINLLSNDVARFDQVFLFLHYLWIMPIQGAAIAYLIWQSVKMATLAGIFLIIIQTIPLQGYLGKWSSKLRAKIAVRTDERIRLMSEIINGIQVIKMYTWEKPFQELVSRARKYEIDVLTVTSYLRGFNRATFVFTERTTLFFTLMAFVLRGEKISADIVFSMAQYFNRLQATMAIFFPMAVAAAAEAMVSVKRLEQFLLLEEQTFIISPPSTEVGTIKIKDVTASWVDNSIANTLHNINIKVDSGQLCSLVGPVGSGKSSLLQLILGELRAIHGHVTISGKISFASQEPWLFHGSVKSNILFGQPYVKTRYEQVTRVCALLKDFAQLPQGDKTLVGERGTSLSGGQRARINLARAVYRDVDIYLLDDPLSAVDTHVGKSLFEDCIKGFLGKKTRILVTHQVQYLKDVDLIVMLNNGVIEKQGDFKSFNQELLKTLNPSPQEDEYEISQPMLCSEVISENGIAKLPYPQDKTSVEPTETEELMVKGQMAQSLYWRYFRAGGSIIILVLFVFIVIFGQLASSGTDYWVSYWTKQEEQRLKSQLENKSLTKFNDTDNPIYPTSKHYFEDNEALWIYGFTVVSCVVLITARNLVFYKICMNSSENLHNTMFSSLLKAPMRFFNTHPSGRILNRFSKDVGCVDELLPMAMIDSIQIFSVMIGILGQVILVENWTIIPIIIMAVAYWLIRYTFLTTAQDLKRLEGVTKSPVFSHVTSSLAGLTTIRSAGGQQMIIKEFDAYQDVHTGAYSLIISTGTAFGLWLDIVTVIFVAVITYSFISFSADTYASSVGLVMSQIIILCGMMQYGMRQTTEMVAQMTSVERILQYTELETEGPFESTPDKKPPASWPDEGHIKFDHVFLQYSRDQSPVLKDLNISIKSGMKVGIVGRTGAGKSSLISALFNLTNLQGDIYIDEINTKQIGLHDLRRVISIIPQEPMLFSATLRDNLDPFNQYEDIALWRALEDVELKVAVNSLDYIVSHGGSNFSSGQRQLLCLARAIVKNNKILVLDEATANVDPSTDALIQKTIREKFNNCTVLTIAHRLHTVMDSDKVIVMDHGRVMEFDHPYLLLQKQDGFLTEMVNQTGKSMTDQLKKMAESAYKTLEKDSNQDNLDNCTKL